MRTAKLCVTVTAATMAELRERRDRVVDADLVELRVDTVRDPERRRRAGRPPRAGDLHLPCRVGGRLLHGIRGGAPAHCCATRSNSARSTSTSSGRPDLTDRHRQRRRPRRRPVDARLRRRPCRSRLRSATAMRATGAEVVKLAVMAHRLSRLPAAAGASRSRRVGRRCSSRWATRDSRHACSPHALDRLDLCGRRRRARQMPAERAAARASASIASTPAQPLYGVVGRPVMHSLSPAMHNAAFRAARHRCRVSAACGGGLRRLPGVCRRARHSTARA